MARVTGARGLRGAMRIEALTDWPEHLDPGELLFVEGEAQTRRVLSIEWGGRVPVVSIEGIDSREAAEALQGRYLEVEATELPEGSYYWHQLEGLSVSDPSGAVLGTLTSVFRVGENEVYRIESADGAELLIPALRDVVRDIDLDARRMVVSYETEDV